MTFRLWMYVDQGQVCSGCATPVRQHDQVQSNWPVGRRVLVPHWTVATIYMYNQDACPLMITVNYNFLLPASS